MINNMTMYEFYKESLQYKHDTIINSCVITDLEKELANEILNNIKDIHPEYINITHLSNFTNKEVEGLRINKSQKLFISNYFNSIRTIRDNNIKAKAINNVKINKTHFTFILYTFNKLLWKAIIDEAYVFKYGLIGRIYAVCRKNESCKPKMNWKASLTNRKAIIDKGGIPRVELEARRAAFNNEQYNGEDWIETSDPFNVTIIWKRTAYSVGQVINSKDYAMKLVKSRLSNGVIQALKDMRDNNRLDDLLIKYSKNHG